MKKKILVVDDAPTARTQIAQALGVEFECVTAKNGAEGLQKALTERPHAMVVDLEMPMMDGIALLRALKRDEQTKNIPVVIATTVTAIDRINQCRTLGCAGFVLKPAPPDYLRAKLRQLTNVVGK